MSAPTGLIAIVEDRLRTMVADSTEFRSWCNKSTRADALAHIYADMSPDPASGFEYTAAEYEAMCPYAIVRTSMTDGYRLVPVAADLYKDGGTLEVYFCDTPSTGTDAEENRAFKEHIAKVMLVDLPALGKLSSVAASAGLYLCPERIALELGPTRTPAQEADSKGDIIQALFSVQWGAS